MRASFSPIADRDPVVSNAEAFYIAIVGRPNVGKSTLFNRFAGRRLAIVDDQPGVTRDRRIGEGKLGDLRFRMIDTAGFEPAKVGSLEERMLAQTERAIQEADLVLMLIDARAGLLPEDEAFARLVRKSGQPVILAANKAEGKAGAAGVAEAFRLGLGEAIALSAEHGDGTEELYRLFRAAMVARDGDIEDPLGEDDDPHFDPEIPFEDDPTRPIRIAILGRPNAGKSTLINSLVGQERVLTGPEAGITRDSISVDWVHYDAQGDGRPVVLWDTAGMRRRSRVTDQIEKLSVADGLRAIRFAEVCILLIDAQAPFDKQDIQLADMVEREGRALVIAINKWDLKLDRNEVRQRISDVMQKSLPQLAGVPIIMLSALSGKGLERLMPTVIGQYQIWNSRISTGRLNRWLGEVVERHPPPADKGRPVRLRYMTQAKSRPPTFVAFSSRGHAVPDSYLRYLANNLRSHFKLTGVPVRIFIRKGKNPYD